MAAFAGLAARAARIGQIQIGSKEEMQQAISLLGLSNACARQLITDITDPESRSRLMAHSERIGDLVETARKAATL